MRGGPGRIGDREGRHLAVGLRDQRDGPRPREEVPDLGARVGDPRLEAGLVEAESRLQVGGMEVADAWRHGQTI